MNEWSRYRAAGAVENWVKRRTRIFSEKDAGFILIDKNLVTIKECECL